MSPIGRDIEWRVNESTMFHFRELMTELEGTSLHSPRHPQLLDDIRSLPGFPHRADPERDLIHLNVTTEHAKL